MKQTALWIISVWRSQRAKKVTLPWYSKRTRCSCFRWDCNGHTKRLTDLSMESTCPPNVRRPSPHPPAPGASLWPEVEGRHRLWNLRWRSHLRQFLLAVARAMSPNCRTARNVFLVHVQLANVDRPRLLLSVCFYGFAELTVQPMDFNIFSTKSSGSNSSGPCGGARSELLKIPSQNSDTRFRAFVGLNSSTLHVVGVTDSKSLVPILFCYLCRGFAHIESWYKCVCAHLLSLPEVRF